ATAAPGTPPAPPCRCRAGRRSAASGRAWAEPAFFRFRVPAGMVPPFREAAAMRGLFLRALVVLGLLVAAAAPASAMRQPGPAFGDCASPDYLARFDERFGAVAYDCVERLRLPVTTRSGVRHIRLLHDLSADWLADEAM